MELKSYQATAVESGVEIFDRVRALLDEATTLEEQRAISSHDGCILLEAPTGAGKTLIAGHIAQEMSRRDAIVWFWFAPFAGLVEQSEKTIAQFFPELQTRNLLHDRHPQLIGGGDVFVATWAAVAAGNKDSRKVRTKSETAPGLDELLPALRERGLRVGAIVDEAHHSFSGEQTAKFFREILRPEYSLLVTATPGDTDAESFRRKVGIRRLQQLTVSRSDAFEAGLIKRGIKCAAYFAQPHLSQIADYETQALRDGWDIHTNIKTELASEEISLTPLMLVQIDSQGDDEARVRQKLEALGVPPAAIAVHTAKEPDADVLSLAYDESKEVLIFKMAVALGFDAPRAWTLISMRGARDDDFGTQIVGRILRVHPSLQRQNSAQKTVPESLQWGYVVLADAGSQSGLLAAGERINKVQTNLAVAGPTAILVRVDGTQKLQIVRSGQPTLEAVWDDAPILPDPNEELPDQLEPGVLPTAGQLSLADIMTHTKAAMKKTIAPQSELLMQEYSRRAHIYKLRNDAPRVLRAQFLPPDSENLHAAVAAQMPFTDAMLSDARRQSVDMTRDIRELFGQIPPELQRVQGKLSGAAIEERAQKLLFKLDGLDSREIQSALLQRLKKELEARGQTDLSQSEEKLWAALSLILVLHGHLLREAQKTALLQHSLVRDAAPLPDVIESDEPYESSLRNVYGIFPPDLPRWEKEFARLLDQDPHNVVQWWHRNPSQKEYSARVLLPNGSGFFPDFAIGVQGRNAPGGVLLLDTKGQINEDKAVLEAGSNHPDYGRVMLTCWENESRWRIVEPPSNSGRSVLGRDFDTQWLVDF